MAKRSARNRRTRKQRGGSLLIGANAPSLQGRQISFQVIFGSLSASNSGPILSLEASQIQPTVTWSPDGSYTLVCWDPDAPAKSWLHWLVINCTTTPESGKTLQPWAPPSPPPGSGTHRYIFGLFQQSGPLNLPSPSRSGFQLAQFAKQAGLIPLAYKGIRVKS